MTENRGHSGGRARARYAAVRYQTVCSPVQNDPNGTCTRAQANGVTTGTSETTFSPDNDCTRAQIVTFLYRAMK